MVDSFSVLLVLWKLMLDALAFIFTVFFDYRDMAVASGPAGPVLARPVFTVISKTTHVQIMNNE